ncbi:MAG: hypothetical protein AAB909_01560 [Patescibacteria group bacterium]
MFNNEQLTKISDLFMDIAKSLFAAGLLVPAVISDAEVVFLFRCFSSGAVFFGLSLWTLQLKKRDTI